MQWIKSRKAYTIWIYKGSEKMTVNEYIMENDVDINDNGSLGFHLEELTAQIVEEGGGKKHPLYKVLRALYARFKEIQPI